GKGRRRDGFGRTNNGGASAKPASRTKDRQPGARGSPYQTLGGQPRLGERPPLFHSLHRLICRQRKRHKERHPRQFGAPGSDPPGFFFYQYVRFYLPTPLPTTSVLSPSIEVKPSRREPIA